MGEELLDCLPHVDDFLFFLNLPTGAFIIGIIELILPFFFVGYHLFGHSCEKRYNERGVRQIVACSPEWADHTWIVLFIVNVISAVFVLCTVAYRRLKGLLFFAICVQMFLLVVYLLLTGVLIVLLALESLWVDSVVTFVVSLLIMAVLAYFVIVLYSWYKTL